MAGASTIAAAIIAATIAFLVAKLNDRRERHKDRQTRAESSLTRQRDMIVDLIACTSDFSTEVLSLAIRYVNCDSQEQLKIIDVAEYREIARDFLVCLAKAKLVVVDGPVRVSLQNLEEVQDSVVQLYGRVISGIPFPPEERANLIGESITTAARLTQATHELSEVSRARLNPSES